MCNGCIKDALPGEFGGGGWEGEEPSQGVAQVSPGSCWSDSRQGRRSLAAGHSGSLCLYLRPERLWVKGLLEAKAHRSLRMGGEVGHSEMVGGIWGIKATYRTHGRCSLSRGSDCSCHRAEPTPLNLDKLCDHPALAGVVVSCCCSNKFPFT